MPNDLPDLPLAHRLTLYRAAQEGLTNAQRHAHAKNILLALAREKGTVTLTISDDGIGYPDAKPTGFGLLGLKERATLLGGQTLFRESTGRWGAIKHRPADRGKT